MASVSTKLEMIASASTASEMITLLVENLEEDQRKNLEPWIESIEEYAERIMTELSPTQLKRRKIEVVAAAAVYDAFLEFESRTNVKLRLPMMHEALKRSPCSINTTWGLLFDKRASLRGELLDEVYAEKNGILKDAISNVIQGLQRAVDDKTSRVLKWLEEIKMKAIELSQHQPPVIVSNYDLLVVAAAIIYAAIQQYHGKTVIRIAQRDLALLSASSPAMISKCWVEFFGSSM